MLPTEQKMAPLPTESTLSRSMSSGCRSALWTLREPIRPPRRTNGQLCHSHHISPLLDIPLASTQLLQFETAWGKSL
ncbi:hypothetical protein Celaphus_00017936 [Cervus elaphus hippelaphus]|uniref:Uncharacterized protein n=1 Tax=Cervus elaphus hippelaphus TaxID=46360 RepID=A0A212C8D0_CEREH|nr:hypothetical protein Celaphus_00017936 [Cervus elaphus hippelaphus]